jgi:hypothetical protein
MQLFANICTYSHTVLHIMALRRHEAPTSRHSTMDVCVTYMIMLHDQQQRVRIRTKYKKRRQNTSQCTTTVVFSD